MRAGVGGERLDCGYAVCGSGVPLPCVYTLADSRWNIVRGGERDVPLPITDRHTTCKGDVSGQQTEQRRVGIRHRRVERHVGDAHRLDREPHLDRGQNICSVAYRMICHAASIPLPVWDVKRFRITGADIYRIIGGGGGVVVEFDVGHAYLERRELDGVGVGSDVHAGGGVAGFAVVGDRALGWGEALQPAGEIVGQGAGEEVGRRVQDCPGRGGCPRHAAVGTAAEPERAVRAFQREPVEEGGGVVRHTALGLQGDPVEFACLHAVNHAVLRGHLLEQCVVRAVNHVVIVHVGADGRADGGDPDYI